MYSSLDRIDIVTNDGGRIQSDHREAAEIEAERELSVVFAVTRVLNAFRGHEGGRVVYTCQFQPPAFLVEAIELAGGDVEVSGATGAGTMALPRRHQPDRAAAVGRAAEALRALGKRVLAREGCTDDVAGIEKLETELGARAKELEGEEGGEILKWTSVVELGAAVGEALFAQKAGSWQEDAHYGATVPFMVQAGDSSTNVFGKIERFLEEGPAQAPSKLLLLIRDEGIEGGPLMPNFKQAGWPGLENIVSEPLLAPADDFQAPWIAYGNDRPNSFAYLMKEDSASDLKALRAEAERNLRGVSVEVDDLGDDETQSLVVHGSFYASEKLLDTAFMRTLHARLDTQLLVASVPRKGLLLVSNGMHKMAIVVHARAAESMFDEGGGDRISKEAFAVLDGKVEGFARVTAGEEGAPKKTSFWKRLLGKN